MESKYGMYRNKCRRNIFLANDMAIYYYETGLKKKKIHIQYS